MLYRAITATKLIEAGVTSVTDLAKPKYFGLMKPFQRVGLVYAEHMAKPASREQAEIVCVRCIYLIFSVGPAIQPSSSGFHSGPYFTKIQR